MSKEKPLVFLAAPSYGSIEPEQTVAVLQAGADLIFSARKASLLAMNFNTLWCQALNNRHLGFDYFAMLHADIYPLTHGWLKRMIGLLDTSGADVLSVIAPLKDDRGLTSAGWLGQDRRITRFTMTEVMAFPETFTAESLGVIDRVLVMNTGLWICRWDQDWIEKVHFEIRDNIVKDDEGKFKAVMLPEDWGFSQQCANLGVKIALTRAIPLQHFGRKAYENTSAWGTETTDRGDPEI